MSCFHKNFNKKLAGIQGHAQWREYRGILERKSRRMKEIEKAALDSSSIQGRMQYKPLGRY